MPEIRLADHVARFSKADDLRLSEFTQSRILGRRDHLFEAGGDAGWLVYVESGLLRLYGVDADAKERTFQFALEGWWLADWEGFSTGRPTPFAVQAVEESRVVLVARDRYEAWLEAVPALERYFRRVNQRAVGASQRRLFLQETSDAEETYRRFVEHYPGFVQRVPQYMLASFLGFTPEFLSRIRARS